MTIQEVATLLTAWQLPGDERDQVLDEVQVGSSSGWWDRPIPGVPQEVGALASYEADAYELVDVSLLVIPGLLQTYETAVSVLAADDVSLGDVETSWMARLRRQQILTKVIYRAFISESALKTRYGSPDAVRQQLEHLLLCRDRGTEIRIIPAYQTQVTIVHPFLLMRFPHTTAVVHVEFAAGAFYVHGKDVTPYESILRRLDRLALPASDTRRIIADMMKGL